MNVIRWMASHAMRQVSILIVTIVCLLHFRSVNRNHGIHDYSPSIGLISKSNSKHYFTPKMTTQRGGGVITVQSGCRMSKWVYFSPSYNHIHHGCNRWSTPLPGINQFLHNASQLNENDTVYVPFTEVDLFVNDILDGVSTDIIVISGDWRNVKPASNVSIYKLLTHPNVLQWFCQNLPNYGGADPFHPKIAPFPY
jgi:hypothetical protein